MRLFRCKCSSIYIEVLSIIVDVLHILHSMKGNHLPFHLAICSVASLGTLLPLQSYSKGCVQIKAVCVGNLVCSESIGGCRCVVCGLNICQVSVNNP